MKETVFSAMQPSGKLHLGNYLGALVNFVELQKDYDCFFSVVDIHALTSQYSNTEMLRQNTIEMTKDFLAAGLDPKNVSLFVQSHVPQHAELHLLLSMITPLGMLERVPTYKDKVTQLAELGKDINTYGFLGYPLLQTADIILYKATLVPVGKDQIPHLELAREIVRKFNNLYGNVFPEPNVKLNEAPVVYGLDGRKMSKSYGNEIALSDDEKTIRKKVQQIVTDTNRVRRTDCGDPNKCVAFTLQKNFNPDFCAEIMEQCPKAGIGCSDCKASLANKLIEITSPFRENRVSDAFVKDVLTEGARKAKEKAVATMDEVKEKMGLYL